VSEVWKRCEGQLVDNQFLLQKFIAATTHSVVFLGQTVEAQPQTVAIKFIPAKGLQTHQQLALWNRAAQLTHKNLLHIFHSGQCNLARTDLLYVVMEYAEEDLSQVVPQRALTPDEAREMLPPLMDALSFLHCNGLIHGHLKPSNILAIADQLKLSPEALSPLDEFCQANRDLDVYDAPETSTSPATPARDVWSLGAALLEILTQQTPNISSASPNAEIPATVPEPFREIIRLSLSHDALQRPNLSEITERLNPTPVKSAQPASVAASPVAPAAQAPAPLARSAAAASSSAVISSPALAPLSVPLSPERAVPLAQLRQTRTSPPKSIPLPSKRAADRPSGFPNLVIPALLLGVILVIAFLATPRLFRHISESTNAPANSASLMNSQKPQPAAPKILSDHPVVEASSTKKETAAEKKIANESLDPFATHSSPLLVTKETAAKEKPVKENIASPEKPISPLPVGASAARKSAAVQNQVLPQVSQKALSTISGVVRVVTLAHLDPSGNVSEAELQDPGPSKYFAEKSLQAAQRWKFSAPEAVDAWQIRFEFSKSGVQAFPSPQ
jgi:serine/threonine protein kinase